MVRGKQGFKVVSNVVRQETMILNLDTRTVLQGMNPIVTTTINGGEVEKNGYYDPHH